MRDGCVLVSRMDVFSRCGCVVLIVSWMCSRVVRGCVLGVSWMTDVLSCRRGTLIIVLLWMYSHRVVDVLSCRCGCIILVSM